MKAAVSVLEFPRGGLDKSRAFRTQPAYPGTVYTTADTLNCRAHEWRTDRARGGSRPGLTRYYQDKTHDAFSIQDINQMFLAYVPPDALYSYFVYARPTDNGFGIGTPAGASHDEEDDGAYTFSCSCWDDEAEIAYVALIDINEATDNLIVKYDPATGAEVWSVTIAEEPEAFVGMTKIGEFLYVAWFNSLATPASRVYKINVADGSIVGDPNPFMSSDTYAGLVFTNNSFGVLAKVADRWLGVQTTSSTGRFSVWDTQNHTASPAFTSASQGTYNTSRACKADSDGIEFFYAAAPVTGGKIQKIKHDGTVVWSYTPVSDDSVISYDKPAYRVAVLSRDTGILYTVNAGTGLLQDTVATPGGLTTWREVHTDWRGNVVLWANAQASNDVVALDAQYNVVWGPTTFANATHERATALRDPKFVVPTRTRILVTSGGRVHRTIEPVFADDNETVLTPRDITPVTTNPNSLDPNRPVVFSWQNGLHMYYFDGGTYRRYEPEADAMEDWTASAGSMPVDSTGHRSLLGCTWNARTVHAGFRDEPQNIYFSAFDNPRDYDTAPAITTGTQAYVLNASNMGMIGQRVTALIPFSDDVLIVGCDGSIWQITGDPMYGGRIDNLSRETGIAFGEAWCFGPGKMVYFFSTRGGVYSLVPGQGPERVSQAISDDLYTVNTSEERTSISMCWDDRAQGLFVFITDLDPTKRCLHYFYDRRWNGWWPFEFAHPRMNPKTCHPIDGDRVDDKVVAVGSWDSHVRVADSQDGEDDGVPFQSYVAFGPVLAPDMGAVQLDEVQVELAEDSDGCEYHVAAANSCQRALDGVEKGTGGYTGEWQGTARGDTVAAGRGPTRGTRARFYAGYVYIRGVGRWAIEGIRVRLKHCGVGEGRRF